jgi:hypothetical protein
LRIQKSADFLLRGPGHTTQGRGDRRVGQIQLRGLDIRTSLRKRSSNGVKSALGVV